MPFADIEKRREYHREYWRKNPEFAKSQIEKAKEWAKNNPELVKEAQKRYRMKPESKIKHNIQSKEWNKKNPEKKRMYDRRRREKNSKMILLVKSEMGCEDCGFKEVPEILEFHHLYGKDRNLSTMSGSSTKRLMEEMKKCVIVCRNCHGIRHMKEGKLNYNKTKTVK